MSKIGRLNYYFLKPCGPLMMFRINLTSTFEDVKKTCCEIWSLNPSTYSIYDDAFNNLECCNNSLIHEFFNSYQPHDHTLKPGEICFYLVEKLKHQRELLDMQVKSIDSKSDVTDDTADKSNNFSGNDLENCIELLKNKKILKGIDVIIYI